MGVTPKGMGVSNRGDGKFWNSTVVVDAQYCLWIVDLRMTKVVHLLCVFYHQHKNWQTCGSGSCPTALSTRQTSSAMTLS